MPLFVWQCSWCDTQQERFVHHPDDKGCATYICSCGGTMAPVLSVGNGLLWAEEGRGRWIHNMGHKPVYITSHEQHKRLMKQRKLELAGARPGQKERWI